MTVNTPIMDPVSLLQPVSQAWEVLAWQANTTMISQNLKLPLAA